MTDVNVARTAGANPWRAWAVVAVAAVVVAAVGYAAWRHMVRPVDGRLESFVELLAIDPAVVPPADIRSKVSLAGRFAGLTPRDEMYLTRRGDGSLLALFPTYYGNGTSIACLLYTSRPLRESDTYMHQRALGQIERVIDVPPYIDMKFDGRIDDHWYRVSYGMR